MKKLILILLLIMLPNVSYGLPTQPCEGLSFTAPTQNTDGSPLIDLVWYFIYWTETGGVYSNDKRHQVTGTTVTFAEMTGLINAIGKYFVVTAVNSVGFESEFSNEFFNTSLVVPNVPGGLGCSG